MLFVFTHTKKKRNNFIYYFMRIVYRLLGLAADMVEAARSWVFSLSFYFYNHLFYANLFVYVYVCMQTFYYPYFHTLSSIWTLFMLRRPIHNFLFCLINLIAHLVVICWCESENCCLFNASISMLLPFYFILYVNISSRVDICVCVSLRCVPVNALHFLIILLPWV